MWDLGSRGVVALISVPSGCVFLYNVWGPILVVTISFFLVVYACCSLIVNDTLLSPHAFLVYDYCKQAAIEIRAIFESIVDHVDRYVRQIWESARNRYSGHRLIGMERRRGNNYQLSSDSPSNTRNSSRFGLIGQLSPIPRSTYKSVANKFYHDSDNSPYDHSPRGEHTSTPMYRTNSAETENRMLELHPPSRNSPKKGSPPMYTQNHTLTRGENSTYFSPEGSPWGTSISPKMRPKAGGVKTVQTVAGPLLASTRYNIDSKVYNDVTSPGLTTRLTKYATEANKKLTHQAQYGTGQFPKVNLQASPIPLRNVDPVKTRMPNTVRIEPPSNARYSPLLWKDKIISPPSSASQVLRDKAVKRQASREDVPDLVKKQRAHGIVCEEFKVLDETKQKRSRDDSSKSEEDVSPLGRNARRVKRTKTRSCYDILNSFSSSKNVASGVKRKAMDFSRSGTPDFEKHFKSLEGASAINVQALSQPENIEINYCKLDATEKPVKDVIDVPSCSNKLQEHSPIKGILKSSGRVLAINTNNIDTPVNRTSPQSNESQSTKPGSDKPVKLTDKLFMRAEPQRNEKYRLLIEEQGNIKSKFTTNDVDEIKKEDIVNMRKTSMKARLQSMFDAISGKASSRINPDVVIQAEEVTAVQPSVCPVTCATLNSSTTTTNVNTTPISTSAVAPVNESIAKSPKHVAFNIPNKECTPTSSIQITTSQRPSISTPEKKTEDIAISKLDSAASKPAITFTTSSGVTATLSISQNNVTSTSSSTPKFGFGNLQASTATPISCSGTHEFGAVSSSTTTIASTSSVTLPATTVATGSFGTPFGFNSAGNVAQNAFVNFSNSQQRPAISNATIGTSSGPTHSNSMSNTAIPVFSSSIKNIPSTLSSSTITTASFTFGTSVSTAATAKNEFSFGTTAKSTVATASETTNTAPVFRGASNAIGSFGTSLTAASTPQFDSSNKSIFGNATNAPIFGSTKPQTASTTLPSTTGTFGGFGVQKTVGAPMFGSNANVSSSGMTLATGPNSGIMTTSSAPVPTPVSVTVPTFGSNSNNAAGSAAVSSSSTLFSNTNANVNANLTTTMTTMPTATTFATTGNIFGNAKPLTSSFATASAPIFGNNTTSLFGSQTTPVSTFSGTNVASTIITPTFGTTSVSSSATVPTFGTATNTSTATPAFGTRNVVVTAAQKPTPVTQAFGTGAPMFGTDTTPTSVFRGITTGMFNTFATGANNTQQQLTFVDNKTPSLFGGPAITVPTFGGATSVTPVPAFGGGTNVTPIPAFGSTPGATTAPTFGGTTGGTTVPTFGEGTSATTVPAFGGPTNSAAPLAFGGAPTATSSAPAFGATSSNSGNNNNSNMFTFGGNKTAPEQSSNFSFTNNQATNNNAAPSMATTFQFGATTPKPVAGFNFSAPTTTPSINFGAAGAPVFNAPAPRMFSIGSGTTAPRSRNVRSRRPK